MGTGEALKASLTYAVEEQQTLSQTRKSVRPIPGVSSASSVYTMAHTPHSQHVFMSVCAHRHTHILINVFRGEKKAYKVSLKVPEKPCVLSSSSKAEPLGLTPFSA